MEMGRLHLAGHCGPDAVTNCSRKELIDVMQMRVLKTGCPSCVQQQIWQTEAILGEMVKQPDLEGMPTVPLHGIFQESDVKLWRGRLWSMVHQGRRSRCFERVSVNNALGRHGDGQFRERGFLRVTVRLLLHKNR